MARTASNVDQPRYAKWVSVSHSVDALDPGLAVFIQGLGKIDAKLVHEDAAFRALPSDERGTFEESLRLTDRFTLSQLWVLGAYEATRTIDDRVRKAPKILTKRLNQRILSIKKAFARVRMPLAKFEPASAHRRTDFSVAIPAMHLEMGISWKVARRILVPRRNLSDKLLALLGAIQRHQDRRVRHLTLRSIGHADARRSP
jgi:hypothetical protein